MWPPPIGGGRVTLPAHGVVGDAPTGLPGFYRGGPAAPGYKFKELKESPKKKMPEAVQKKEKMSGQARASHGG